MKKGQNDDSNNEMETLPLIVEDRPISASNIGIQLAPIINSNNARKAIHAQNNQENGQRNMTSGIEKIRRNRENRRYIE